MKLTIVLLTLVGLVAAVSIPATTNKVTVADHAFLEKQKFLLEIVYRVEDPLMFEEYIKLGQHLVNDQAQYSHFDYNMERFYESYKMGALLPRGEFFGAMVHTHHKQAYALFNYFYYAKDWETFQQNVAWARIHVNEGMFVYALTLAVIHRDDFQGLILPTIYEIFPQYFFNSKFIYAAEKFDYNTWSKYTQYEKEFNDVYYQNNKYYNQDYFYMKDFKTYQWWKLMGIGENWYAAEKNYPLRENTYEIVGDEKYASFMKDVNIFWHPVDYTRDIEFFNEHSVLSYFTEDLGLNSYWYYLNMDYAFFLNGDKFGLNKDRRSELWIYNVEQLLSRYYMERLSHGFGDIPELSWYHAYEYGYDPELVSFNGAGYTYRKNYFEIQSYGNFDMLNQIQSAYKRIYGIIESGVYTTRDGHKIDLQQPEAVEYIADYLQGNVDIFDKYVLNSWYMLSHMLIANTEYNQFEVIPNVILNYETMMRDPLFYSLYKQISTVYYLYKQQLTPYTREELALPGVEIKRVGVSEMVTYYDLVDFDVTNLMNDKMVIVDGQFVWDKALYARQMRLNHKPFNFDITVQSDKPQKVVIRAYYGPKYDEYGRIISLNQNRQNFVELDEFVYELSAGENVIRRSSDDFYWTVKDRTTYTELYRYVMAAFDGKYALPLDISEPHSGYPDRLLLAKGWAGGFPVQLLFYIAPYQATVEQAYNFDASYSAGIGSGARYVDNRPFGYPLDRPIDEYEFFVPNMYFVDASIYHQNTLKQYYEGYKNYGQFDYSYYNNYYTNYFH
ncbi:larval serum protein 1 beta chain-like [Rhagoletis pomonella]|uniref:larval serum protein 1 beta chain-like n=1 Tax=Rhagoletis pomonella TaxID=28610 RepID=UPI0017839D6B|nr:larval serum protein 1 beta chain-like [Rhagoletis pomonella]